MLFRSRAALASPPLDARTEATPPLPTVSLGVATCPADGREEVAVIVSADRALYDARAAGKNRVVLYGASTRSYARRKVSCHGRVLPVGTLEHRIEVTEIGEGGLAFQSDRSLAPQMLAEVAVTLPNGEDVQIAGRVVWCRRLGVGQFETAMRFLEQDIVPDNWAELSEHVASYQ